ncbi:MAG: DMT family transporter [Candidatus Thorarchaeota archaeon]|nr:DMT family transporter [Candidatus Thorarchaeota archaeon]
MNRLIGNSTSMEEPASKRSYLIAVAQACLVTVLWSSSWVIIKFGLEEIPPLIFAGLRYSIASFILLILITARVERRVALKGRTKRWWATLSMYGLIYITATQGTQFLALNYLPAITFSLILNLTPILVLAMSIPWLKETPSLAEIFFIMIGLIGVLIFFYPMDFVGVSILGLLVGIFSLISNSLSSIIGRAINRARDTPALIVTGISMSIGSLFLLVLGFTTEAIAPLSLTSWILILWLAVFNTALAFTLWNKAMRVLRAIDSTLINSTMMPQIILLSILFLGEFPDLLDWVGLILLAVGITAVQIFQTRRRKGWE